MKNPTRALTRQEIARLIRSDLLPSYYRRAAILILNTGLRVGELSTLTRGSIAADGARLYVRAADAKGGAGRYVPLNIQARAILRELIELTPPNEHRIARGRGDGLLSVRAFQIAIRAAAAAAGIPGRVSPHTFRHTFATGLDRQGVSIRVIQSILGHARVGTTERYTHTTDEDAAEGVNRLPRV